MRVSQQAASSMVLGSVPAWVSALFMSWNVPFPSLGCISSGCFRTKIRTLFSLHPIPQGKSRGRIAFLTPHGPSTKSNAQAEKDTRLHSYLCGLPGSYTTFLPRLHASDFADCNPRNPKYEREQKYSQKSTSVNCLVTTSVHLRPSAPRKLGFQFQCHHEVSSTDFIPYMGWRKRKDLEKWFGLHEHHRPSVRACPTSSRNVWNHGTAVYYHLETSAWNQGRMAHGFRSFNVCHWLGCSWDMVRESIM